MFIDTVDLARTLIRFNTTNPPGQQKACLDLLKVLFERAGFSVASDEFAPGRSSLVASLGPGRDGEDLCFGGHIDTVGLGTSSWKYPPFEARVSDNRLYGRGACDMKSGIAALVSAALALAPFLRSINRNLTVQVYGGEETGCQGSLHLQDNPVLRSRPGGLIIGEPSNNRLLSGHKGALWLEIKARGKTAHSSMPENGDNALVKSIHGATLLEGVNFSAYRHPVLGEPTLVLTGMQAGHNINAIPDVATFTVDIRTVPGFAGKDAITCVTEMLGDQYTIRTLLDIPPVWTEPSTSWVVQAKKAVEARTGVLNQPGGVQFFTDAAALRMHFPDVPVIILGPADPCLAHQTDEFCPVDQITVAREIYLDIAADWYGISREALAEADDSAIINNHAEEKA